MLFRSRYTILSVVVLAVMKHLVSLGIPIDDAIDCAKRAVMFFDGRPDVREFHIYFTDAGADDFPEIHGRDPPAGAYSKITIYPISFVNQIRARLAAVGKLPRKRRRKR